MKIIFITIILIKVAHGIQEPLVQLPLGIVEGYFDVSFSGRTFYGFKGIPYAQPPIGNYRFREPIPVTPWEGIRKAKTDYRCMQYYHQRPYSVETGYGVQGDEDCLYLNIFTPTLDNTANLDVIVFIHGGAFMFGGSASYEPHYLLDKDVLYITLNYRVGPLGFLSTENDVVPGNNGMKDQIMALRWIKDNVKYFGGNPNSVTIFGMSAGGASVHLHYLMKKSKGLFQKGVSQSGTALNSWVLMENALEKTKKLADTVGCSTENIEKMVDCMRDRPGRQIVAGVREFQPWLYNPFSPFAVVVDTWSRDPLLEDHPYYLIKKGKVSNDVPWLSTFTDAEGLYPATDFYPEVHMQIIDQHWNEVMPSILHYNYTVDSRLQNNVSQAIRNYYLKDKKITKASYKDLVKLIGDRLFIADIEKTIRMQATVTVSPIYVYYFGYRGVHSNSESTGVNDNFGASHGDDTAYVLKSARLNVTSTENDRLMQKFFTKMFTSFAKDGRPSAPVHWPSMSRNSEDPIRYLNIQSPENITAESTETLGHRQFWDSLPFEENDKLSESMAAPPVAETLLSHQNRLLPLEILVSSTLLFTLLSMLI